MKAIFSNHKSQSALESFLARLASVETADDFEKKRNILIETVIKSMKSHPDTWDEKCQINIVWLGDDLLDRIQDYESTRNKPWFDMLAAICFRFLFEFYLSSKTDMSFEFERDKSFVFMHLEEFDEPAKFQIKYALIEMPISIFKSISNGDAIDNIKDLSGVLNKAEQLKISWDKEVEDKERSVNELKKSLSKYETAYNFIGLHNGFDDLAKNKIEEKKSLLFWLRGLGALILLPVIVELTIILIHIDKISEIQNGLLISFIPLASIMALSVYYFRVLLFNHKSVNSQLMQIELRKTLCRFIQHYTDYSKEIKSTDKEALAKFENVIFAGIISDGSNLPSTYDGLDQIGKLIKSARG